MRQVPVLLTRCHFFLSPPQSLSIAIPTLLRTGECYENP